MEFKEKLQAIRKKKGLSQENLAESIGVSRQAVARWELGQSYPELDKLIVLSNLFGVSIDKLVKDCHDKCNYIEDKYIEYKVNEEIINFLIKAKKSTYAGKGSEIEPSRPNSHDLQYTEGVFKYIDTYIGNEKFAGEEAL